MISWKKKSYTSDKLVTFVSYKAHVKRKGKHSKRKMVNRKWSIKGYLTSLCRIIMQITLFISVMWICSVLEIGELCQLSTEITLSHVGCLLLVG